MTADNRLDRAVSTLSRRSALAGGALLLTAGGSLVWVGEPASAQVSAENFSISDADFESDSADPVVDVDVAFAYDVGTRPVAAIELTLGIDGTTVTEDRMVTDESVAENETQLSGRVADSDAWSLSDFAPEAGSDVTRDITVSLGLAVLESDDSVIVEDSATDTATVAVSHPVGGTASVGGIGTIRDDAQ